MGFVLGFFKVGTRVPRGFSIHLNSTNTWNLSFKDSSYYSELEYKNLEILVP